MGQKVIILCAGYATRLYPLTENMPKPLLPIGNRPILEWILERVEKVDGVGRAGLAARGRLREHALQCKLTLTLGLDHAREDLAGNLTGHAGLAAEVTKVHVAGERSLSLSALAHHSEFGFRFAVADEHHRTKFHLAL